MKVSVFGAGYVGLVSAVCLAKIGHDVVCVDNNAEKIHNLKRGIPPIYEQGLEELLKAELAQGSLTFTTKSIDALKEVEIIMVAVGTPLTEELDIDLTYVNQVIASIAEELSQEALIVLKSTVPPGTSQQLNRILNKRLAERQLAITVDVANNPEFLQEGNAIQQFMQADRIIIGASIVATIERLKKLYQPLLEKQVPLLVMDKASAELTKYAANAFLASKVSFINEISQIADKVGANIQSVAMGMGKDYRINPRFLNAGCGFGGSCFPKDIMTLIAIAKKLELEPQVLESVIARNTLQQRWLFDQVSKFFKGNLRAKTIALWGLTFKPNTDDVRYATSHVITDLFCQAGCHVRAYDPLGSDNFAKMHQEQKNLTVCQSAIDALETANILVISTEWRQFTKVDLSVIKAKLSDAAIFDGRNLLDSDAVKAQGFYYCGVGV